MAYSAAGDTNLDWTVDMLDAANFLAGGKFDSSTPATWNQGDFNYDGFVDILDVAEFLAPNLFDAGSYNAPSSAAGIAAVPEPAGVSIILGGLACGGWCHRRRRRRTC
ncbi:MAG: PEP-CTERM sorting domain-containing protein [Planctomycetaceae bacterium]